MPQFIVSFFQNRQPHKGGRYKLAQPIAKSMQFVEADSPKEAVDKAGCSNVEKQQDSLHYGVHSSDFVFPAYLHDPGIWVFALVSQQ